VGHMYGIVVDVDHRQPRARSTDIARENSHDETPARSRAAWWSMSHVPLSAS
jgi:hypothetical protein